MKRSPRGTTTAATAIAMADRYEEREPNPKTFVFRDREREDAHLLVFRQREKEHSFES